jgi:hypothetical protein
MNAGAVSIENRPGLFLNPWGLARSGKGKEAGCEGRRNCFGIAGGEKKRVGSDSQATAANRLQVGFGSNAESFLKGRAKMAHVDVADLPGHLTHVHVRFLEESSGLLHPMFFEETVNRGSEKLSAAALQFVDAYAEPQ